MRESTAFRRQARADIEGGALLGGATCAAHMRAHVLAKSQQGVEKVMKAAIVILTRAGVVIPHVKTAPVTHMQAPITHEVASFADSIALLAAPPGQQVVAPLQTIARALTRPRRNVIAHLDAIAPSMPAAGALHIRNTEYPYEVAANDWLHPSDPGAFTAHETGWLFAGADEIVDALDRIVQVIERTVP